MDIKIDGITEQIMEAALAQALEARLHILGEMNDVLAASRATVSDNAPSMVVLKVDPDKIRDIIGKGGATIRSIVDETGAEVDVEDDGTVRIYAEDRAAGQAAVARVQEITAEAEVGKNLPRARRQHRRLRRLREHPARQGRPPAHFANRQGARGKGERLPAGRPGSGSRLPGHGPAGPHQALHEGSAELRDQLAAADSRRRAAQRRREVAPAVEMRDRRLCRRRNQPSQRHAVLDERVRRKIDGSGRSDCALHHGCRTGELTRRYPKASA